MNVRHAFGLISPRAVRDKRVALVDDVKTTGATLKAAATAIMDGEPAAVHAIVLAAAEAGGKRLETGS
jgi:predicted amidophosphoribosyltransferase